MRKLFADAPRGARASATCYSLVETAKLNGLEQHAYFEQVLAQFAEADTVQKLEALLPWNVKAATGCELPTRKPPDTRAVRPRKQAGRYNVAYASATWRVACWACSLALVWVGSR